MFFLLCRGVTRFDPLASSSEAEACKQLCHLCLLILGSPGVVSVEIGYDAVCPIADKNGNGQRCRDGTKQNKIEKQSLTQALAQKLEG